MLTITQSLKAISLYPINPITLQNIVEESGFVGDEAATPSVRASKPYRTAKAQVYMYLALAPAVNEAGASYSFTDEERKLFRSKAQALLADEEDTTTPLKVGCVGEDF